MRRKRRKGKTVRLLRWAGWTIIGIVFSAFLFVIAASAFGWRFDVVPTESMEPAFKVGGMVITRPVEMEDIRVGDPILFREPHIEPEARICHRVIDIQEIDGELHFQTKGDAAEYADSDLVSSQNFIGKTIFYVPHVGDIAYRSHLHHTPVTLMGRKIPVALLLIVAVALIVIGTELKNVWEWAFRPHVKRHQEILNKRKERLLKRRSLY